MSAFPNNVTKIVALCQFVAIFVASFYRHATNIVAEFVTSVILSYHLVAATWLSYVRQSNYIATLVTVCHLLCCHVTDMVLELVKLCHCLVATCVRFAQQRNQNCHSLSVVAVLLHLFTVM